MTAGAARVWRDTFRHATWQYRSGGTAPGDDQLREMMERAVEEHRDSTPPNAGLYVAALALLTFGRIDMVPVILAHYPRDVPPLAELLAALPALVPLPARLRGGPSGTEIARRDPDAVRRWVEEHRDALRWDESAGRFELT